MLLDRFEESGLAHYSYAVGCPAVGRIAIVDPRRDIDVYLEYASRRKLTISYVLETHIHADYASGAVELAEKTGAELIVSGHDEGELYQAQFTHTDIYDGDSIDIGNVRLDVLHTPGHTPEHISFLVFDENTSRDVPISLLSGDFLFVGAVGRPDLIGEDAKLLLARQMYASIRDQLGELADGLEVCPAHGAGSMCGSGMSGRPSSTLGYERITNPYLRDGLSRDRFVEMLIDSVPPFPDYYRIMKTVNSVGARTLDGVPGNTRLTPWTVLHLIEEGALVLDLRDQLAFGRGHIPHSYGIGAGKSLSTWAAWVVPYDRPIVLVAQDESQIDEAVRALVRVGLDQIEGFLEGGMEAWEAAGYEVSRTAQVSPAELHDVLTNGQGPAVVDVRSAAEFASGHIAGAQHLMAADLARSLAALPESPIALICGSGYRSTVAASVLERLGIADILNVTGGMGAWNGAGLPVVTGWEPEVAETSVDDEPGNDET